MNAAIRYRRPTCSWRPAPRRPLACLRTCSISTADITPDIGDAHLFLPFLRVCRRHGRTGRAAVIELVPIMLSDCSLTDVCPTSILPAGRSSTRRRLPSTEATTTVATRLPYGLPRHQTNRRQETHLQRRLRLFDCQKRGARHEPARPARLHPKVLPRYSWQSRTFRCVVPPRPGRRTAIGLIFLLNPPFRG